MNAGLDAVVDRLAHDRPTLHPGDKSGYWKMDTPGLRLIARWAPAGGRTLEVGAGASTVILAAAGGEHTAISPDSGEHALIRQYCDRVGVSHARLTTLVGTSDQVLPALPDDPAYDLVLIDGSHSFPHPVLDYHHANRRLRVGGLMVLDDVPIAAVAVVARYMRSDPAWRVLDVAAGRAAAFLKVSEPAGEGVNWESQPFNRGVPDYCLSNPAEAFARRIRHRAHLLKRRLGARRR